MWWVIIHETGPDFKFFSQGTSRGQIKNDEKGVVYGPFYRKDEAMEFFFLCEMDYFSKENNK
jgi:hypothetical protein